MKKFVALLLSIAMMMTMAACTGSTNEPDASLTPARPDTTTAETDPPSETAAAIPVGPSGTMTWGDWSFAVPDGFELKGGDIWDENDTRYFSVRKSETSYFDFRADDDGTITQKYNYAKENYTNEQKDVQANYGGIDWVGFQYSDGYLGQGFEAYATVGGKLISVSAAFPFDSDTTKEVLGSLKRSGADGAATTGNYDWWEDDWYGWWAIKNGTGVYQDASDKKLVWDTYAEIDVYNDNTGRVTIWDTETSRDEPMIIAYDITFEPGASELGRLVSKRVDFFPCGKWNNGWDADPMSEREIGWVVDPADSTVSRFENMIEIKGHYVSPVKPDDSFDYYIYLRPWGTLWDDVRNGNTEGCLYKDMMPLYHDDWYISMLNLGYEHPTATFQEGIDIINDYLANQGNSGGGGGTLDPAAKEGADGKVDMATLKTALAWCKENASYSTPYDEIAAQFGVHGKQIESFFENNTIYRWWATEDAYVQITFTLGSDGSELWNVTQYDGIS